MAAAVADSATAATDRRAAGFAAKAAVIDGPTKAAEAERLVVTAVFVVTNGRMLLHAKTSRTVIDPRTNN
jgi:hypothetical protein